MRKTRVLLDVDGVLRDWWGVARLVLNHFGKVPLDLLPNNTEEWFSRHHLEEPHKSAFIKYLFDPGLSTMIAHKMASPLPGAKQLYAYLTGNFDVTICSSQGNSFCQALTEEWLRTHMPKFKSPCIFAQKKENCIGDILIDDKPENLNAFGATGRIAIGPIYNYNMWINHNMCEATGVFDMPGIIEYLDRTFLDSPEHV